MHSRATEGLAAVEELLLLEPETLLEDALFLRALLLRALLLRALLLLLPSSLHLRVHLRELAAHTLNTVLWYLYT